MTILHLILWIANGVCVFLVWAYLIAAMLAFLRRRRQGYQPKASHTGAPSNPPSGGSSGHRSPDAIITELRAALDSGRLHASVARINRRNETRRMQ